VQDLDQVTHFCEPPHPAWDALQGAFLALQRANGQDPHLGRRQFGLLRGAGLEDVGVAVRTEAGRAGDFVPTQLPTIARSIRERVLAQGLLSEAAFAAHLEALERHLADPGTLVVRSLMFQAWGRKPA